MEDRDETEKKNKGKTLSKVRMKYNEVEERKIVIRRYEEVEC